MKYLTIPVLLDKVAPDWSAWFAPDRECWMAIALLDAFCQEDGRELASNDLIAQALEETRWPGRLEIVSRDPLLLLDGAHNPHAIKALLATLQERFADYHKEILFTCIKTRPGRYVGFVGGNPRYRAYPDTF